ncbi:MAG: 30S ribosomal protein S20 [Myxococcota bacterium]
MAHHASAEKAHRQSQKRRTRNRHVKSTVATCVKQARQAIAEKKAQPNTADVYHAVKQLAHAASKGVLHKRTAARRASRLMQQAHRSASQAS